MTRLSTKALRLYAEIDLLVPADVDPTSGYRYYHPSQANRAEAVRILRSVDMPLDEIKVVLEAGDDPELVGKHLDVHRDRLAERLAEDERMLRYLESLIKRKEGIMPYTIEIEEVAPMQVASIRIHTSIRTVGRDVGAGFGRLLGELDRADLTPAGAPLTVQHDIIDKESDGDIELCVPIDGDFSSGDEATSRELEGGLVAWTIHHGRFQEIPPAYHSLTGWISENGHVISGPPREIYLTDPQVAAPEDLQTRIEFPIEP